MIVFFVSLMGLYFGIKGLLDNDVASRIRASGVKTEGTLLSVRKTARRNLRAGPWVAEFRFEAKGTEWKVEQDISLKFYHEQKAGHSITIYYIPANPSTARIAGEENPNRDGCYIAVGAIILDVLVIGIGVFWH
jgi:Protein of unknown function (DUF3592)